MAQLPSPDDRPDPSDRMPAVRARVPEHVAIGQISTGVIVVTGATEYILDFVRNLPRPNMIVARVVLPHAVMPQFTEALTTNIALYRQRFGEIPMNPANAGPGVPQDRVLQDKPVIQLSASSGGSAGESSAPSANPTGQANVSSGSVIRFHPRTRTGPHQPARLCHLHPSRSPDMLRRKRFMMTSSYGMNC